MLVIYSCIIAIIIALLRYKSADGLFIPKLRRTWLVIPTVLVELLLFIPGITFYRDFMPLLTLIEYIPFFIFLVYNASVWQLSLTGAGVLCNYIAAILSGGFMPVSPAILYRPEWSAFVKNIKNGDIARYVISYTEGGLALLSKQLYIPFVKIGYVSIGEIITALGLIFLILRLFEPERVQPAQSQLPSRRRSARAAGLQRQPQQPPRRRTNRLTYKGRH